MKLAIVALVSCLSNATLIAQSLVVDQATGGSVSQGSMIPDNGQIAQSFTPTFSDVGFVQLLTRIYAVSSGETVVINLREGAYNGPIVSSTDPVFLVNKGTQINTFYFPANIPITPNQVYYFEPVVQSTGSLFIGATVDSGYSRGDLFANGTPSGGVVDLWFQEGIVAVPEPSTKVLFGLAIGLCWFGHRRVGLRSP